MILDSLYGVLGRRPNSHITKKIIEDSPSSTNANTTCSIIFVVVLFWIFTTSMHGTPATILRSFAPTFRVPMFSRGHDRPVFLETSAAICLAAPKPPATDFSRVPADTLTHPNSISVSGDTSELDYFKTSECLSHQIKYSHKVFNGIQLPYL